jgi:uncharacterized protein (TIGR02246 family)
MKKITLMFIGSMFITSLAMAQTTPITTNDTICPTLNAQKVAGLFDRWNASLQTKNPQKVAENYAQDAVLLPTLSNKPRTDHEQIIDYFTSFLQANPVGTIDERTIRYGTDWASDTGLYTFKLTENGKVRYIKARYSFVYECIKGHWLIIHQHSSAMPMPNQ